MQIINDRKSSHRSKMLPEAEKRTDEASRRSSPSGPEKRECKSNISKGAPKVEKTWPTPETIVIQPDYSNPHHCTFIRVTQISCCFYYRCTGSTPDLLNQYLQG